MIPTPSRDTEIKAIWKEYKFFYQVSGGVLLCAIGVLIGAILFSSPADQTAYLINLYTSILSIVVTVFVLDLLNRRRDERNAIKQLQEQLRRDASSIVNDVANNAVHQLRKREWLKGDNGLLKAANLMLARLQGAHLAGANLQEAFLVAANLQGAYLSEANLQAAFLVKANLQGAKLFEANLQGAKLWQAKLYGADLSLAKFDETTILPDGSPWTPETDMTRFTKPEIQAG